MTPEESKAREGEIQREVWTLIQELRELHEARTGHAVWTHRRNMDTASRCFTCPVEDNVNRSVKTSS